MSERTSSAEQATTHNKPTGIVATVVPANERMAFLPKHFGNDMLHAESAVYESMTRLCRTYQGGYWEFVELSNGGCYLRLTTPGPLGIRVDGNGFGGEMSVDAASIVATLFALNALSWERSAAAFADQYYLLFDYAMQHEEKRKILGAID